MRRARFRPAQPDRPELGVPRRHPVEGQVVERGHRVTGPDRPGIHARIAELAVGDGAVLVADQPVGGDRLRIERDLDLGVEGDRLERPGQVLGEQPAGLGQVVDVGIEAVALVGQLLEQGIVVVAHPDPDRDELDPGRGVVADLAEDPGRVGQSDVGDAVRGKDDPVDPAVAEVGLAGKAVAEPETRLEVGRAAGLERVDGGQDGLLVGRARRWQDDAGVVTERDDRDRVALAEAVDQLPQRILDQLEAVAGAHRARGVDHEGQRGVRAGLLGRLARLDPDPEQDVALVGERGRGAIDRDREGRVLGSRIALVEGVDPLLDADAGRVRDVAVGDVPLGDRVRRGVDVHREGGQVVLAGIDRRVLARVDVGDAAIGRRLRLRRRSRPAVVLLVGAWTVPPLDDAELPQAAATRVTAARARYVLRIAQPPCWEPGETPG